MQVNNSLKAIQIQGQQKTQEGVFPKVYGPGTVKNYVQLQQYFYYNHDQLLKQLTNEGVIYFRGFDIKSTNQFAAVMNKFGFKRFEYIGGAAVRKLLIGSQNSIDKTSTQVFTTNQAPPSQPIPFHNELLQTSNYPEYVSFACFGQAQQGGSTPIVNCHQLYKYVEKTHPEFLKQLQEKKVRYIRIVGKQDNPNSPIGRGWKNIFKRQSKQEAQAKMKESHFEFKWLENDFCQLISQALPAINISKSEKKVFCNQMIAVLKGWIDDRNKPQNCLKFGDFTTIPKQIVTDISDYADKIKAAIPWKKGDFMIIDNFMVAHARQPFKGDKRKVVAALYKGVKQINRDLYQVLNSGDQLPQIGFGTWKIPKEKCADAVYNAIKSGYRLFDCACDYGNQQQVGEGIKRAISENIVKREQLWITSKLWNTFHHPDHVKMAFMKTLNDLGLEYLDLYLIHFPISLKFVPIQKRYPPEWFYDLDAKNPTMQQAYVPMIDTWKQLQKLVDQKLIRNIGLSNCNTVLIRDIKNSARIPPSVLQIQIHPYLVQKKIVRFCRENNIQVTSFSTLGANSYLEISFAQEEQTVKNNATILQICKVVSKSPYQVVLRWAIQSGLAIIPKTVSQQHLNENKDILGWTLTQQQMTQIDSLNRNRRYNDPGVFCEKFFNLFFPIYD